MAPNSAVPAICGDAAPRRRSDAAGALRILVVHNRYQVPGGEDVVVAQETGALRRSGQIVKTLFVDNDAIRTPIDRIRAAVQASTAPAGIARVVQTTAEFAPDVVHFHNTFPLISPSAHRAVGATGAATVQTLHNFRLICANAQLMRNGLVCEDCINGSPYNAVLHGCYRGSRLGSLAVAHLIDRHRRAGTWTNEVDRFIALTAFAKERFVRAGVPASRISVKANGLPDCGPNTASDRSGFLYAGRLGVEKGIRILVAAAASMSQPITVLGDGPLRDEVTRAAGIVSRGRCDRAQVREAMATSCALIVPSLWYEGFPMVVAEAFAAGTPVIASRIGGLAEIIEDGVTGVLVEPGNADAIASACAWITKHPDHAAHMGRAARAVFERDLAESVTTGRLLGIYADAISSRRSRSEER